MVNDRKETGSEERREEERREEEDGNSKEIIITTQTIIKYLATFHFHGHLKYQEQGRLRTTGT